MHHPNRPASDTDFFVPLPNVGTFRYGRRTYGDRIKIRAAYLDLLGRSDDEGVDDDLAAMSAIVAAHRVLCVSAPEGWGDLAAVDLITDPTAEARILELYALLKQKEDSFRGVPAQAGAGGGA
jgi:hypothetical protein